MKPPIPASHKSWAPRPVRSPASSLRDSQHQVSWVCYEAGIELKPAQCRQLLLAQDLERFLTERAMRRDPTGEDGERGGDGERGEVDRDVGLEGEVHGRE